MVIRIINLAVACWALQLSSMLCLSGVLTHPCDGHREDSGSVACCSHDQSDHQRPEPGSCPHEDGCRADPCQDGPVVKEGSDFGVDFIALACAAPGSIPTVGSNVEGSAEALFEAPPSRPMMPLHESDLPLQI